MLWHRNAKQRNGMVEHRKEMNAAATESRAEIIKAKAMQGTATGKRIEVMNRNGKAGRGIESNGLARK